MRGKESADLTGTTQPVEGEKRQEIRTCEDDNDCDADADGVLGVADKETDDGAPEQEQDERVLVDLLRELEQDVLGRGDGELVQAVRQAEVGDDRRQQTGRLRRGVVPTEGFLEF